MVAVLINLGRGRRVDCHCFGSQDTEPLGWPTVIRLIVLLAGAAIVVAASGSGLVAVPATNSLPGILLALGLILGLYLLRAAPPVWRAWRTKGAPAPTRYGSRVSLRGLPLVPISVALADRTREVSGCGACRDAKSPREARRVLRWLTIPGRSVSG